MSTSANPSGYTIGNSCTTSGGQVTIAVPSNGTILVQAQVWVELNHVSGTEDAAYLMVGDSPTNCAGAAFYWPIQVPSAAPSDLTDYGAFPQRPYLVTAGTYTFYLNGFMFLGPDASDGFIYVNMVAVFYPS